MHQDFSMKYLYEQDTYRSELCAFISEIITPEYIMALPTIDFGKFMAIPNENYMERKLNNELGIQTIETTTYNNRPGYDILTMNGLRIQAKFRQWSGKNPYSRQQHFETTRRHSTKNLNAGATGHITYSDDEFDCVLVTLCPVDNMKRSPRHWSFSCVPTEKLKNKDNEGYLISKLPSKLLEEGKNWIDILLELDNAKKHESILCV